MLCLRLLGFWILSTVCYYKQQISKTGSVFIYLFFFYKKLIPVHVLFIILDNGQSNPWDVFYWLISSVVFSNICICFKMSNSDNLQWDFLSISYVAIVFISKADEFWCVTFEPDVVSVAITSCSVRPVWVVSSFPTEARCSILFRFLLIHSIFIWQSSVWKHFTLVCKCYIHIVIELVTQAQRTSGTHGGKA